MIIVYTGNGKGKTSACIGQAMRALPGCAGEQTVLARLLGDDFLAGGKGFLRREEDRPAHREAALATLDWARQRLERLDMLVLDETLYALKAGILERSEVEGLMEAARRDRCHLVLSGRDAPDWLVEAADLVTEMGEIKHPWRAGIKAAPGIEFCGGAPASAAPRRTHQKERARSIAGAGPSYEGRSFMTGPGPVILGSLG